MTHLKNFVALTIVLLLAVSLSAQTQTQTKTQTSNAGTVKAQSATLSGTQTGPNWVDENGDGICDNYGTANQGTGKRHGRRGQGMNNGTGTRGGYGNGTGLRPQDGTGLGRKGGNATGTGTCDGTGPKGKAARGNN